MSRLLSLPNAQAKYEFRAIVRNADKAKILAEKFGVKTIVGSHSDQPLMEKEASEADVILAMADCDDISAAEGINKGLKKRFEATGKRPILTHTVSASDSTWRIRMLINVHRIFITTSPPQAPIITHTACVCSTGKSQIPYDTSVGEYTSETIYDDENVEQLDKIFPDALHRPVNLEVLKADEDGYVKTHTICPGIVYDGTRNALVDAVTANSETVLFKMLVPPAIKRGYAIIVGKGENVWLNVHIDEAADFHVLMFTSVLDDSKIVPHGKEGYLFLGAEEHKSAQYYTELAKILFESGKVKSPEPKQLGEDEVKVYYGAWGAAARIALGGNARFVGNRAKKLGWKPVKVDTGRCRENIR
ncbi:hypothetical protein AAF712_011405 [Marasmius tenuissimus]|uniref:NAD(P)-binding protein n=1 Tax=Marasmius tenuissimus TaxID=585030 RepID=A0ABR2ZK39_9AGAR